MNNRKMTKITITPARNDEALKKEAERLFALLQARNNSDVSWIVEDYAGEYATQIWIMREALYA